MKRLVLHQEGDWISFRSSNSSFVNCVKSGITPSSYRKYDVSSRAWLVYYTKAPDIIDIASKFYQVDWGELPGAWQMLIAGGKSTAAPRMRAVATASPYSVLYLLDSAPPSVVKAVYKTLLHEYHPDQNGGAGDGEKLNEVIAAYRKITKSDH